MIIHSMNTVAPPAPTQTLPSGIAALPHLGVIRARGVDAGAFLQGQLTQDFLLLKGDEARLAAFCSAKGRMQASFVGFKRGAGASGAVGESTDTVEPEILLICDRDILANTLKRLSMFVLRAKVKLSDATEDFQLLGLTGDAITSIANYARSPWALSQFGHISLVSLYPADGVPRALWVAPTGEPVPDGSPISTEMWQWGEVRSGIASISAPIVDAFVPQMLNYESVGGVNFKKGCYPGQEVVARSQFRGTLKRRAYVVHGDGAMAAGDEVFGSLDAEQACGTVAQAAVAPNGGFDAIVSLQIAAAVAGGLTIGSANGPQITVQPLPYPLLEDI